MPILPVPNSVSIAKPVEQKQEISHSEPKSFASGVQASILGAEDIRMDICLLEASPVAPPTHVEDIHMRVQESMAGEMLAAQKIDSGAGPSTSQPQRELIVPSVK